MKRKPAIVLLSGLLFACTQAPPPAAVPAAPPPAPPAPAPAPASNNTPGVDHYVAIQRARCDRFLALSADDRTDASMFYIGYEARRFGTSSINVGLIPNIAGLAIDFCSAEPNRTVASAFAEAYLETRKW